MIFHEKLLSVDLTVQCNLQYSASTLIKFLQLICIHFQNCDILIYCNLLKLVESCWITWIYWCPSKSSSALFRRVFSASVRLHD